MKRVAYAVETFISDSSEKTQRIGEACGTAAEAGLVIALHGGVGAGKTTFVGGLAHGIGVPGPVLSPTFTLISEHWGGRVPLYHIDLYRLGESSPIEIDLLDEYFFGDGVCAVEWAAWLGDLLPPDRLDLRIEPDAQGGADGGAADRRVIRAAAAGPAADRALREWVRIWRSLRSTPPPPH